MFPQQHFRLTREALLLAMVASAFPVTGYCVTAGRADFVVGNVVVVAVDGSQRPLAKGTEINVGEAINTAVGARAQIRFTDGGYVSLQPNSQFRVDEYQYEGKTDGKEKGFFSLLRGGLRTITGAIGHVNRAAYQVATPAATIGIRGTGYNATLSDGLFVHVGEGAISLTNNAGLLVVTSGNSAFVADFNTQPALTFQKPITPPASFLKPVPDTTYTKADERDATGDLTILPSILPSLASGPGYHLAYAYLGDSYPQEGSAHGIYLQNDVTATFTGTSQLTQYQYYDGSEGGALGTAQVSFSATDGIIGWGRWDNGTTANAGDYSWLHPLNMSGSNEAFHYVTGISTPNMPTTGVANYSLMGYTTPSATDGSTGWSVLSGSLTADFRNSNVTVNMNVGNGSTTYNMFGPTYGWYGANFYGWPDVSSDSGGCADGCEGRFKGFFAGADATRAGLVYEIYDYWVEATDGSRALMGAAAFRSSGITSLTSGGGYALAYAAHASSNYYPLPPAVSGKIDSGLGATFNSDTQLTKLEVNGVAQAVATQIAEAGNDDILGWGRWTGGTASMVDGGTITASGAFHYVVGIPTPNMPTSGTAYYSLIGATTPTANDGTEGGNWSLSYGYLTAHFANSSVDVNLAVHSTSGTTYSVYGPASISGSTFSGTPGVSGCASGCNSAVNGFFAGSNAVRAGLSYQINDLSRSVQGAAAFSINGGE